MNKVALQKTTCCFCLSLAILLPVIVGNGCRHSNRPEDLPDLYPTTIKLIQEGQPLPGAMIFLHPEEDSGFKWSVGGLSDATGTVRVATHSQFAGAPAGRYKVVVMKTEVPQSDSTDPDTESSRSRSTMTYLLVEPKYSNAAETPLEAVVAAGKNELTLNAGKAVRIERKVEF